MKTLIKELVEIPGPSGHEANVREYIIKKIKPFVTDYKIDSLGNLIATIGNKTDKNKTIMLSAHMDEIGVIITHIDKQGFGRFTTIGGVIPRNTAGGRVRFLNGTVGVIGMEPGSTRTSVTSIEKMYIDFGTDSSKLTPVSIGDVGVFDRSFEDLGNRLVSKAMDDRIGVAILIESVQKIKNTPNHIVAVFSVQEEVGVRGATAAAFGVSPDIGLGIDVTLTGDTPNANTMEVHLGKGPAIKIKDSGMISTPSVVAWMESTAKKYKIPYQKEVLIGGSTDARAIQLTKSGVPSGCLSIPCRYVHSPSEMIDMYDVENSIALLVAMLNNPVKLSS